MALKQRVHGLFQGQRRRLAGLFLVAGLLWLAQGLFSSWPRQREVRYALDGSLRQCRAARIDYRSQGEPISSVRLRFLEGAPDEVVHRPTLAEGRYDVTIDLTLPDGHVARRTRVLKVPYEGAMRFRLADDSSR